MKHYAITFPQLISQAMEMKLGDEDIARLRDGYDLAERMADGLYRSQGCAFIHHLVRTASIVMAHGGSINLVLAAMLHSSYMLDCFQRSRRRGFKPEDRAYLAGKIGVEAEVIVWEYHRLGWGRHEAIATHIEKLSSYGTVMKSVLLIRLANELEDYLDLAALYRPKYSYRNRIASMGELCIELAGRIGVPDLGQALRETYEATVSHQIPAAAVRDHINAYELPRRHFHEKNIFEHAVSKAGELLQKFSRT